MGLHLEEYVVSEPCSKNRLKVSFVKVGKKKGDHAMILEIKTTKDITRKDIEQMVSELPSLYEL